MLGEVKVRKAPEELWPNPRQGLEENNKPPLSFVEKFKGGEVSVVIN